MQVATIPFRSSQIHYGYGGNGNNVLLCLHGYGESENTFHFLENFLPRGYCMIAIDLPFHGHTQWKEKDFTVDNLVRIIDDILAVRDMKNATFTLLGFSMGGRMALNILQIIPQRIHKMILMAPDGLKVNFWYYIATQTGLGNRLFHITMKHPGWLFGLMQLGHKLGFFNRSVHKFASHYVHDKTMRRQLFVRWTGLRKIKPDLNIIKQKITEYKIPVALIYGEYDRIIRHERGSKFRKGIEAYCHLQVVKAGHQLLHEKNAALIAGLL